MNFVIISLLFCIVTSLECYTRDGKYDFRVNDIAYICVSINDDVVVPFRVGVDKYTRLMFGDSYSQSYLFDSIDSPTNMVSLTVSSASQSGTSIGKAYIHNGGAFALMTAVIHAQRGVIQAITWDDICFDCIESECIQNSAVMENNGTVILLPDNDPHYPFLLGNNCWINRKICREEPELCDLQIHVSWDGTDADGVVFRSVRHRLSRLPVQTANAAYNAAIRAPKDSGE